MARIQYSALIDNIRGSIGGTTFQSNKYGYTVKQKPNMSNPNTSFQARSKWILSNVTRAWRDLSAANRQSYADFAATYPHYAKHNPASALSGYALFVKYNFLRNLGGSGIQASVSGGPPPVVAPTYEVQIDVSGIIIDVTNPSYVGEWSIMYFLSRPFGAANNFIGTKTRFMVTTVNDTIEVDVTDDYLSYFGSLPAVGDRVALDIIMYAADVPYVLARSQAIYTTVAYV